MMMWRDRGQRRQDRLIGRRWLCAGAALALLAIGTATTRSAHGTDDTTAIGTIDTSMVEMLGSIDTSDARTLAQVRQMVAGTSERTTAGVGVDVALIDTGVAPVTGLDRDGKVLHGPDLSFEGAVPEAAYIDTYGHGTHMAAIIAGERNSAPGIAPGARIVSLKVAGHDGITTVPQVVAAIDWVVEHRNTDGLNIRVLNLSLGQAGITSHVGDHLSAAVERAWHAGIVVVVAAGNRGETQPHLDSPAIDPYPIAIGAMDTVERRRRPTNVVPRWSALGDGNRNPDVVALGQSIASYRVPGSTIDRLVPEARLGEELFVGTGTSQSAAITTGVVAALLHYHPELTPDEAKAAVTSWADEIDRRDDVRDGDGSIDGLGTVLEGAPSHVPAQDFPAAAGPGTGIETPTHHTWTGGEWTDAAWSGATWSGTVWSGATWSGATWSGATWSGATWSGATWSGATWSGATWSGATWSGATWSGATWSGATWSGQGWS